MANAMTGVVNALTKMLHLVL